MKKAHMVITVIIIVGHVIFGKMNNQFADIAHITIQKYEQSFTKGNEIHDKKIVAEVTKMLNRADRLPKNIEYKIVVTPEYKILLTFNNKSNEEISIVQNYEKNKTLLVSNRGGYYIISKEMNKELFKLLLP